MEKKDQDQLYYVSVLQGELHRRKKANSSYSLRSFAQGLEIDPSLLSRILLEKQLPSLEVADLLCRGLKLSSSQAKEFIQSVVEERNCVALQKINPDYTDCE